MRTLIAVGALLALLQAPAAAFPFERAQTAPWCAEYWFLQGAVDCAFSSNRQCQQSLSGVGGICYRNRWFAAREHRRERRRGRYRY